MKGESFLTLIFGTAIGVAAGLLFAPDKGTETRKKLKACADKNFKQFKEYASETYDDASDCYEELRSNLNVRARKARIDLNALKNTLLEEGDNLKEQTRLTLLEKLSSIEDMLQKTEEDSK